MSVLGADDVSRETNDRLSIYLNLLQRWNQKINLVAKGATDEMLSRHFADSAQLVHLATPCSHWADFGSGAGFPGIVVAILGYELFPDVVFTCVESDQRKAAFLRTVSRETGVPVSVISERIESLPPLGADIISARALAPLPILLELAQRHLREQGKCLFMKGETWADEIDAADQEWQFQCEPIPSKTHPKSMILKIGDPQRV